MREAQMSACPFGGGCDCDANIHPAFHATDAFQKKPGRSVPFA